MTKRQKDAALFALSDNRMFQGLSEHLRLELLEQPDVSYVKIEKGNTIFTPEHYRKSLGVVLKGSVQVRKGEVVMSTLNPGELFGAVTLYSDKPYYVTSIFALGDVRLLFLGKNAIDWLLEQSAQAAKNYIAYLTERIYFLNHKIDGFTSQGARQKLMIFLKDAFEQGEDEILLPYSLTQLSERLNVSRASLYRAFQELEREGLVCRNGKRIEVRKPQEFRMETE